MQFIDNVTPSSPVAYEKSIRQDRGGLKDSVFQMSNDWATMYYQNAYNTAMQNYMNEYNSPLQQMLRYQEAGLNPFLAANDAGNMGSSHAGGVPKGSFTAPTSVERQNSINAAVNTVNNVLKSAQQIYDYVQYGRPMNELALDTAGYQNLIAAYNADAARTKALTSDAESAWSQYWNLGRDTAEGAVSGSPRAKYMEESTARISAQVKQLESLVDVLYPSQVDANEARAALSLYQKQVLQGQKGAILDINTGNATADSILQMVCFWLLNK